MHLHDGNGHRVALTNMFRAARKHVVLMENWRRHPYVDDLRIYTCGATSTGRSCISITGSRRNFADRIS